MAFENTAYYNNSLNWNNKVLYIGNYLIEAKKDLSGEYTVKDGTKCIARSAFNKCINLKKVIIPDSVTDITYGAFLYSGIESLIIGKNVRKLNIDNLPENLKEIKISKDNQFYHMEGNCLIENESLKLIYGLKNGYIVIPYNGSVTSIDNSAFARCTNLKKITIPNSVSIIGVDAFHECSNLEYVVIKEGTIIIEYSAFSGCSKLKSITLPKSIKTIGYDILGPYANQIDVYYAGSESDREKISIESSNEELTNATWHYNFTAPAPSASITADNLDIPNEARLINNYVSSRSVQYKASVSFSAPGDIPEGATVHWIVNGRDAAQGGTYTNEKATGTYTVQSKVVDASGNVIAESEIETVNVNTGFFAKLIAFFRSLFGLLPVIEQ